MKKLLWMKCFSTLPPSNVVQDKPSWILKHLSLFFLGEQWLSSMLAPSLIRILEHSFISLTIFFAVHIFVYYLLLSFEIVVKIKVPKLGFPRHAEFAKSTLLSSSRIATLSLKSIIFAAILCWDKSPIPTWMTLSESTFFAAKSLFKNENHFKWYKTNPFWCRCEQ